MFFHVCTIISVVYLGGKIRPNECRDKTNMNNKKIQADNKMTRSVNWENPLILLKATSCRPEVQGNVTVTTGCGQEEGREGGHPQRDGADEDRWLRIKTPLLELVSSEAFNHRNLLRLFS